MVKCVTLDFRRREMPFIITVNRHTCNIIKFIVGDCNRSADYSFRPLLNICTLKVPLHKGPKRQTEC